MRPFPGTNTGNLTARLGSSRLFVLSLIMATFCCIGAGQAQAQESLTVGAIAYKGLQRSYLFFTPKPVASRAKLPLVIALHGGGKADAEDYARRTAYAKLARRQGFIVVFANGIDAQWNDGRGVTFRGSQDNRNIDDVGFISKIIDIFVARHQVDPRRVFVEGTSNGGMMTQRLTCELAGKIAGAASVISSMPTKIARTCRPARAVPMLLLNGTDDTFVPYQGGTVTPLGKPSGEVISTPATFKFWSKVNGCRGDVRITQLPNRSRRDRTTVRLHRNARCSRAPVRLYQVVGGGHTRPGMVGRSPKRLVGLQNRDINASETIWSFFEAVGR